MTDAIVSEIFGPTIHGEGPQLGRRAVFVRLGLCNLDCAWCDTPYTWDWTGRNGRPQDRAALQRMPVTDVLDRATELAGDQPALLVITGGEPTLQPDVVRALAAGWWDVAIETNATLPVVLDLADTIEDPFTIVASPKLTNAHTTKAGANVEVLTELHKRANAHMKLVVRNTTDLSEAWDLIDATGWPAERVWIMPEGRNPVALAAHTDAVLTAVLAAGWNITDRLHVRLWGDTRAR